VKEVGNSFHLGFQKRDVWTSRAGEISE